MLLRQIILDTETTGLHAADGDRLVEFAAIEMLNRRLTGNSLHVYIDPQRDIPPEAAAVHGITQEKLIAENAPPFEQVGQKIADYLRDAELIIHNAKFDISFLDMEFKRIGLPPVSELADKITDTLPMAREMFPGQKASLDALCSRFEIDRSKRVFHGALIDCELLAEVYLAMTRSQFSLVDGLEEQVVQQTVSLRPRPEFLAVRLADADELAEHQAYLDRLQQADRCCVWRVLEG